MKNSDAYAVGFRDGALAMQKMAAERCSIKNMVGQDLPVSELCVSRIRSIDPGTLLVASAEKPS